MIALIEFLETHEEALEALANEVVQASRAKSAPNEALGNLHVSELVAQVRTNVQSRPWGDGPASWHLARIRRLFEAQVKAAATHAPVRVIFKRDPPAHVVAATSEEANIATATKPPMEVARTVASTSAGANIATIPDLAREMESTVLDTDYDRFLAMFAAKVERLDRTVEWVGEVLGMGQDVEVR
ncbi:hypothetical protein CMK11_08570 [Candidatus Poribacteria bacterium]|nr:hypothetical protein [Candidatus Poribacteria bacterium]